MMLSTLPKLADKTFILGFLLPVIIFMTALLFLFSDLPVVSHILTIIGDAGKVEKIIYIALLVWCLSIIMMILNNRLYQIAEGYRWPISKVSPTREIRRFEMKNRRIEWLKENQKVTGVNFQNKLRRERDD